jgi:RHS repeat-associated protein
LPDGKAKYQYQFNSLDQLVKVVKGTKKGGTWTWATQGEYWYDANGALVKSVEGTTTTEYVYRGHDPLCEKNTGTGVFTDYIYVNGRMVAKQTGSDIYYYFKDALGSTRQVWKSGATKAAFSVATYAPFGTPVTPSGTEKFKYAGEMLVGAAGPSPGIYYIGARWMDPELGRFVSLDPQLGKLSSPQTMNRYVYCVNNSLRFTDPTGEGFWSGVSKWWDNLDPNWKTAIVFATLTVATTATAGVLAPALVGTMAEDMPVSSPLSACIATTLARVAAIRALIRPIR